MKLPVTSVLCLSLLLVGLHVSMAGKSKLSKILKKVGIKDKTGSKSQYPKQPGSYPKPDGYPQYPNQPGSYPHYGRYPQQPLYPAPGNVAPGYAYGAGYGNYPVNYINHNPNNKILSPHYGGSFGYGGGYGGGGGSPFSHSVQKMGFAPSDKSKGFGRSAAMAAAGGGLVGMAIGYGLGRFPRPHFQFHSPQEEYYFNYYMYQRYGTKSTDRNDYSRDYQFSQPPETFEKYMTSCMKRSDLLPAKKQRSEPRTPSATTKTPTTSAITTTTTTTSNINNITAAGNLSASSNSTNIPLNNSEASASALKASQIVHNNQAEDDDDTVSIVDIGYPALIEQMKDADADLNPLFEDIFTIGIVLFIIITFLRKF